MNLKALKIAKRSNARFLFASTASEGNPYATSKKLSEYLIQQSGIEYSILRLPETHFIPSLFNHIKQRKMFIVNGDGSVVRDFIHVEDVCDAFIKEMDNTNGKNIVDVGTGIGYSLKEVIAKVRVMGLEFSVCYSEPKDEPLRMVCSHPKYECKYNLDDILKDYADNLVA